MAFNETMKRRTEHPEIEIKEKSFIFRTLIDES